MRPVSAALLLSAALAHAQWLEATIALPVAGTNLAVYNPTNNRFYIGGTSSNWLAILDGTSGCHTAMVNTGSPPSALAALPSLNKVYCATGAGIAVVTGDSNQTVRAISVGETRVLYFYPERGKVYCAARNPNRVLVIDAATDSVATSIPMNRTPAALCGNPVDGKVYCIGERDSIITVIDASADTVLRNVAVDGRLAALLWNPVNNRLYCPDWWDNELEVLDCGADSFVDAVSVGNDPRILCLNRTDNKVYCTNYRAGTVSVVDATADSALATITVGQEPCGLGWDSATNRVFAVAYGYANMKAIDGATNAVIGETHVATGSTSLCSGPPGGTIAVPNQPARAVSLVNATTRARTAITSTAGYPTEVCCSPGGEWIVAAGWNDYLVHGGGYLNPVFSIDGRTRTVAGAAGGIRDIAGLCYNPASGRAYCGGTGFSVAVISVAELRLRTAVAVGHVTSRLSTFPRNTDIFALTYAGAVVIDGAGDSVKARLGVGMVRDMAVSESLGRLYVPCYETGTVSVLDAATYQPITDIAVVFQPSTMCYSTRSNVLYCYCRESAPYPTKLICCIDCANNSVLGYIRADGNAMCYNWRDDKVYATTYAHDGKVLVINCGTNQTRWVLGVGQYPTGICYNSVNNKVYCATLSGEVYVLDGATGAIIRTITIGEELRGIAWDSVTNQTFVAIHPPDEPGSIAILRDSIPTGVVEISPGQGRPALAATVSRGVVHWAGVTSAELLDVSGRRVATLLPGNNSLTKVKSGIYFVRAEPGSTVTKLVLQL